MINFATFCRGRLRIYTFFQRPIQEVFEFSWYIISKGAIFLRNKCMKIAIFVPIRWHSWYCLLPMDEIRDFLQLPMDFSRERLTNLRFFPRTNHKIPYISLHFFTTYAFFHVRLTKFVFYFCNRYKIVENFPDEWSEFNVLLHDRYAKLVKMFSICGLSIRLTNSWLY